MFYCDNLFKLKIINEGMNNPFQSFIEEFKEGIVIVILVIMALLIFGVMKTLPGAQEIATQGENSIILFAVLYFGLPSVAVIILIIWLYNKFKETSNGL